MVSILDIYEFFMNNKFVYCIVLFFTSSSIASEQEATFAAKQPMIALVTRQNETDKCYKVVDVRKNDSGDDYLDPDVFYQYPEQVKQKEMVITKLGVASNKMTINLQGLCVADAVIEFTDAAFAN